MIFLLVGITACSSRRVERTSEVSSSEPGVTVTKEVPSSKETIGEIQEREIREPAPPREDRAIPFHRIPRGDNNLLPPESVPDNCVK
jgi:hypothetical protein